MLPYEILSRKRAGLALGGDEIQAIVAGAAGGGWSDAQLGAFLMAAAIRGLEPAETRALTEAMLHSGERWELRADVPLLCDKHSTGGLGDKVSLPLAALLAACDLPVVMLTGRGLGHTGGTADKLEAIPGMTLGLDRGRCLQLLAATRMAIGIATGQIAPADRRLYALRDQTGTVESLPLITASILSKKLATGAGALVLDVKAGNGAFLPALADAAALARMLVATANALGCRTSAWITDMSQPLGRWLGHACEVNETMAFLAGEDVPDLREVTFALCTEVAALHGIDLPASRLQAAIDGGAAREAFVRWAAAQGAAAGWDAAPLPLAPAEHVIEASRGGWVSAVDCRKLGFLLVEAEAGRRHATAEIHHGVALRYETRLGERVERGQPILRLFLRRDDPHLAERFGACVRLADAPADAPPLLYERIAAAG